MVDLNQPFTKGIICNDIKKRKHTYLHNRIYKGLVQHYMHIPWSALTNAINTIGVKYTALPVAQPPILVFTMHTQLYNPESEKEGTRTLFTLQSFQQQATDILIQCSENKRFEVLSHHKSVQIYVESRDSLLVFKILRKLLQKNDMHACVTSSSVNIFFKCLKHP